MREKGVPLSEESRQLIYAEYEELLDKAMIELDFAYSKIGKDQKPLDVVNQAMESASHEIMCKHGILKKEMGKIIAEGTKKWTKVRFQKSESLPPKARPVAPTSFYKLKTVGDYLMLVGMEVTFGTNQDEFFTGKVVDLSDSGTHLILHDVTYSSLKGIHTKYEKKNVPVADIVFIEVQDRKGKLP